MHFLRDRIGDGELRGSQQRIRNENLKHLFNLINSSDMISRSDLARITGLSPTTVSVLIETLLEEELISEVGYARNAQVGRKPINLQVFPEGRQIPVITLFREGVCFALYNLKAELIEELFHPLDSVGFGGFREGAEDSYPECGADYCNAVRTILSGSRLFDRRQAPCLCMISAGVYEKSRNRYSLTSMHVSISVEELCRLEDALGLPLYLGTVAQSLAYGQKKHLESKGLSAENLLFIAVRNGVGMGMISNGEVFGGKTSSTDVIGHTTINYRGRPCCCGRRGCLELYVTSDAIQKRIAQVVCLHPSPILSSEPEEIILEKIAEACEAGEMEINKAVDEIAEQLYAGINNAMRLTGIYRAYIGCSIERLGPGFLKRLQHLSASVLGCSSGRCASIEFSDIDERNVGKGIAQHFIDRAFEISVRHGEA